MISVESKLTFQKPSFKVVTHKASVDLGPGTGRDEIIKNWSELGEALLHEMLCELPRIDPVLIDRWTLDFSEYIEWQIEGIRHAFDRTIQHVAKELDPYEMDTEVFADGQMMIQWLTQMRSIMKFSQGRFFCENWKIAEAS